MTNTVARTRVRGYRQISLLLVLLIIAAPVAGQRPAGAPPRQTPKLSDPTFETLLATDAYKMYGEVRNVGQLLSTGGAGEIVDPIIKLADPGKEFKSIVSFLKKNSEALASSRLLFASWPARTDVPEFFVAIEFPTSEDAAKFAPKLETFLPTVLPPVTPSPEPSPVTAPKSPETGSASPAQAAKPSTPASSSNEAANKNQVKPAENRGTTQTTELPYVITHVGNLVCISEKSFKFEKLHPAGSKLLTQDQNFRTLRDKFSTEPVFMFFNVALEDKTKPQPSPTTVVNAPEAVRQKAEDKDNSPDEPVKTEPATTPTPDQQQTTEVRGVLTGGPEPLPAPSPTKEQQAQMVAGAQIGQMLGLLGIGDPQWPEAVGVALALDGNEYVVRAMLIDKPDAKVLPLPFVPQLLAGPAYNAEAATVLPDDTEVFVSVSIDMTHTYEGMRKQAETKARNDTHSNYQIYEKGQLIASGSREREPPPDAFTQFEKNAGFKIKDDLLPALGSEIAFAGTLKMLQGAGLGLGGFGALPIPSAKPSPEGQGPDKKDTEVLPLILIGVKDRDAMRKLMPKILTGLGIGEANLIAQAEKRGDAEIVSYAGMFAYGFVGDFLVLSDAAGVRSVVDANVNNQTLSSNTVYRNSRRWQSTRQLGQIYVSPALMEGYHEQIRKQAATMEPAMRDFLLSLNPKSEAITYALANDGLGTNHELHLPKNLIMTMIAGIAAVGKTTEPDTNEMIAMGGLQVIVGSEEAYKNGAGKGSYGTLDQLIEQKLVGQKMFEDYGYKYEVVLLGDHFEVTASPVEYGKTGKRSFFVDKSGVVRGDDHGGGPATLADTPVQP